jgi:hypothetical protein
MAYWGEFFDTQKTLTEIGILTLTEELAMVKSGDILRFNFTFLMRLNFKQIKHLQSINNPRGRHHAYLSAVKNMYLYKSLKWQHFVVIQNYNQSNITLASQSQKSWDRTEYKR